MSKKMKTTLMMKLFFGALTLAFASACTSIPDQYVGSYLDAVSGTTMTVMPGKMELREASGRKLKGKVKALTFERLLGGNSGVQLVANSRSPEQLELYWVFPNVQSRKETANMVWFEAEVLYALLDTRVSGKAENLEVFQCQNGNVLLDLTNSDWQIGCPDSAKYYTFHRMKEEG